jgi:type I restriction enzyme, S subunit
MFKLADAIEKHLAAGTSWVETETQAILAKAFRGELVPTEADLAPAESRPCGPGSSCLAVLVGDQITDSYQTEQADPRPR